jgi:hypothetical protein
MLAFALGFSWMHLVVPTVAGLSLAARRVLPWMSATNRWSSLLAITAKSEWPLADEERNICSSQW